MDNEEFDLLYDNMNKLEWNLNELLDFNIDVDWEDEHNWLTTIVFDEYYHGNFDKMTKCFTDEEYLNIKNKIQDSNFDYEIPNEKLNKLRELSLKLNAISTKSSYENNNIKDWDGMNQLQYHLMYLYNRKTIHKAFKFLNEKS